MAELNLQVKQTETHSVAFHEEKTRDLAVLQLLTRLVRETDRLIRLADDIDNYANTPQAKEAFNLIGNEVELILKAMEKSISPLYALYDIDPGLQSISNPPRQGSKNAASQSVITAEISSRQEKA